MINRRKSKNQGGKLNFSRALLFFRLSAHFWKRLATVAGLALFVYLFCCLISVYVYGGSIFGKRVEGAKIRSIKVRAGSTIGRDQLLEVLNLKPGMPLYDRGGKTVSGDLSEKVRGIMKIAPTISSLEITRLPSNCISVIVTERIPVAWFADTHLAVDAGGIVFASRSNDRAPDLTGFPRSLKAPGRKLDFSNRSQAATLELINFLNSVNGNILGHTLSLTSVDISSSYRLGCVFNEAYNVDVAWEGMGDGTRESLEKLKIQLEVLVRTISHPQNPGGRRYNLTHPNRCFVK